MNLKFSIRFMVWTFVLTGISIAAPFSFGAGAKGQQAEAQLLDHAEVRCSNCFFGPTDYYYCFEVDNKILVGVQKVPVLNWEDSSKNYLTRFHGQWKPWDPSSREMTPIVYDDRHIWVSRRAGQHLDPNHHGIQDPFRAVWSVFGGAGGNVKLTQTSLRDLFTEDNRCRGEAASAH